MNSLSHKLPLVRNAHWREDLLQWCDAFRTLLDRPWRQHDAADLFERIEAYSALADVLADPPLAEACAEITVFLCTFVDDDVRPDAGQRARLERLLLDLRVALVEPATDDTTNARPVERARKFLVHYLRPRDHDQPGLAAALGQQRIGVLPIEDVDAALQALAREQPDIVLLDGAFLKSLQRLSEATRRHNFGSWRRVLWVATGIGNDVHLRLYARRAGIDLLLEDDVPERAAATLLSALLRRREQSHRVLLVEDDRSHITFVSSLLRHQGFELDVAETAAQAQEQLRQRVPDLILLDINLPDMSGLELAQLLREQDSLSHVPIVFLTGEEDMDVRVEAIAAGADDFLSKPLRPRHLIATVNSRIGRARALAIAAQAEPVEDGLSPRLDRLRFVEAMDRQRREPASRAAVVVLAMDDIGGVAARLGFVRAGDLALQIALAIESESGGPGRTCGIGEFSRMVLLEASSEVGLRNAAEGLRARLDARGWLSTSFPLKLRFSAAVVRFDGAPLDADAVIAEALALLETTRREGRDQLGYRNLVPVDEEGTGPVRRVARAILSQPLPTNGGRLQFRALIPLRGTRTGQFLVRTLLVPPGARRGTLIGPEVYSDIASSLNAQTAIDRLTLRLARQYADSALVAKHGWTVLLPVSEATLQEPLFPDWLQREGLPMAQLLLVVRANRLQAGSGLAAAIDRIAQRGWRWVLHLQTPQQFDPAVLTLGNLDALMLDDFLSTGDGYGPVIEAAQEHGKAVIAAAFADVRQASTLFARGVHYAMGDLADEPIFDNTRLGEG